MDIVPISAADVEAVAPLAADFRVTLRALKGRHTRPDEGAARKELSSYLAAGFPCFQAIANGQACGYLVCRIDDDCVFVESLYTRPDHRRQGVASTLLQKAEELCSAPRDSTLYFWVHPNNEKMFRFLARHGYTVLNLVEVRRPRPGETPSQKITVGGRAFDY